MFKQTLLLLKPDCFEEKHVGDAFDWFYESEIWAARMFQVVSPSIWQKHYAEHLNKPFYPKLESFMQSGPIFAVILQSEDDDFVETIREAALGFRDFYGPRKGPRNLIHASSDDNEAIREVNIWGPYL